MTGPKEIIKNFLPLKDKMKSNMRHSTLAFKPWKCKCMSRSNTRAHLRVIILKNASQLLWQTNFADYLDNIVFNIRHLGWKWYDWSDYFDWLTYGIDPEENQLGFGNRIQVKGRPFAVQSARDWWWIPEHLRWCCLICMDTCRIQWRWWCNHRKKTETDQSRPTNSK